MARFRRHRLGLRYRLTLTFAVSAALLSIFLAGLTLVLTRTNLLNQREASATRTAASNARYVREGLPAPGATTGPDTIETRLNSVAQPSGLRALIQITTESGTQWFQTQTQFGEEQLPTALRTAVIDEGQPSRLRFHDAEGSSELAIGVPLTGAGTPAYYFEVVSLDELESALDALTLSLIGAAVATTLAGTALGWWVSRGVLRPLSDVSLAAEAIAGGRLDTRLQQTTDPDLGPLVTSFNDMASGLERRIERDGRFASDVSHELRSPLMTLSASIEVLTSRRDEMPDASAQAAVDLMVADVNRFKQLVGDLLEISRFDAGAARLELDEVRLAELVMQAVSWSTQRDVEVDLDADLAGVLVRADKRRIVRVIANLLDNAEKYGGGATTVSLRHVDEGIELAVEDAGTGVPEDKRAMVFDRFSRGVSRGGTDGMGLGLALVAEHVRLHGGRVWVEDRRDGLPGARFVVHLPVEWPALEPA